MELALSGVRRSGLRHRPREGSAGRGTGQEISRVGGIRTVGAAYGWVSSPRLDAV